ncbi:hypothetical protein LXL04_007261 [Taraxacum kok-saghyz]
MLHLFYRELTATSVLQALSAFLHRRCFSPPTKPTLPLSSPPTNGQPALYFSADEAFTFATILRRPGLPSPTICSSSQASKPVVAFCCILVGLRPNLFISSFARSQFFSIADLHPPLATFILHPPLVTTRFSPQPTFILQLRPTDFFNFSFARIPCSDDSFNTILHLPFRSVQRLDFILHSHPLQRRQLPHRRQLHIDDFIASHRRQLQHRRPPDFFTFYFARIPCSDDADIATQQIQQFRSFTSISISISMSISNSGFKD